MACLASALSIRELYFLPSLEQGTLGHLPFKASGSFMKNKIPTILSFPQIISRSRKTCLVSDVCFCFFSKIFTGAIRLTKHHVVAVFWNV